MSYYLGIETEVIMKTITVTAKTSGQTVKELVHQMKLAGFNVVRWTFKDGNVALEGVKS